MNREIKLEMLRKLILIRRFEEKVKELYNQGSIVGAIHLYIGQEAVATGVCQALRADDYVFSTHRGHGHAIAKTLDVKTIMAELMGRDGGMSRGHGGSMHLYEPGKGLMGGNGIVGGGVPLSLGGAFAAQYRGTDQVSVTFFSDGAANQGTFGESLNLAALFKLPVLFVCENNQYAATTPVARSTAELNVAGRAESYGLPAERVDGNNVLAVYEAASRAVGRIRGGGGPAFLECRTYRIEPHCGIIPDEREPGERESWHERDPILVLRGTLEAERSLDARELKAIEAQVAADLEEAVAFGESSPWPDPAAAHNRSWVV
ncbi:MAG: pyruvate dehydrogenase (acetyl-transferring) E1 component subunit alpha [Spirochaetales bacterium]|nr:pyruvate dehydrogenase (acetyl-transferring) E1 component subunit alpha [Spirochaetales bacterium]